MNNPDLNLVDPGKTATSLLATVPLQQTNIIQSGMYNILSELILPKLIIPVLLWFNVAMSDSQNNTWTKSKIKENSLIYRKSHSKSRRFFSSMEMCVLTAGDDHMSLLGDNLALFGLCRSL